MIWLLLPLLCGSDRCGDVNVWPGPAPVEEEQEETVPVETPDRVYGLGQLWAGVSEFDTGHCPGYIMPSGNGYRPSLAWPTESRDVNEDRPFGVLHSGMDIRAPIGEPVWSMAPGRVIWSGYSTYGFGNTVVVRHYGGWYTLFAHLQETTVSCGQWVTTGQTIGLVGMSGNSSYSHLHWEIRNGMWSYSN
jgi:murein DD-endopeptidase MepM/ murein hydrolase activator NlpD